MNKDLLKLIRSIQKQIVSILLVRGLVTLIDKDGPYTFSNIKITKQGNETISNEELVTDEQVEEYRALWPRGYKGSIRSVKDKMSRFIVEHSCSYHDIFLSAKTWLLEKEMPYHGTADYFFYKKLEDGTEVSRCEEYLNDEKNTVDDFRTRPL